MDREEPGRIVGIALRGVLQYDVHLTHSLQLGRILTALMSGCAEGVVTGCITFRDALFVTCTEIDTRHAVK